jgi:hypothetical protein
LRSVIDSETLSKLREGSEFRERNVKQDYLAIAGEVAHQRELFWPFGKAGNMIHQISKGKLSIELLIDNQIFKRKARSDTCEIVVVNGEAILGIWSLHQRS